MSYETDSTITPKEILAGVAAVVGAIVLVIAIIVGCVIGFGAVGRYNSRQDAQNRVKISKTEIQNQAQRVQIAQQKAEIRKQDAIGVREAQDEIAKTLTPLYVQYEMTQVLLEVARSGRNNSVVYLPSGPNGIPLVDDVSTTKVGG